MQHVEGKSNTFADYLSRPDHEISNLNRISTQELAREQVTDPSLRNLRATSLNIQTKNGLLIDTTKKDRIILPNKYRFQEFSRLHNIAHPGVKTTTSLLAERYVWPKMRSEIRQWVRGCHECQKAKINKHTKSPLGTFPDRGRFKVVHIDIVGPLQQVEGKRFILTLIDR